MDTNTTIVNEHAVIQGINDAMHGPFVLNAQEKTAPSDALKKILVPIQLDALSVRSDKQSCADVTWKKKPLLDKLDPARTQIDIQNSKAWTIEPPEPFANKANFLEKGIHLHWAMPDAFTRGFQPVAQQTAAQEADEYEQGVVGPDETEGETIFAVLPNRWLVVRLTDGDDHKKAINAWIVLSDNKVTLPGNDTTPCRIIPIDQWTGETMVKRKDKDPLTAIGCGDPAFIAYYDNVRNRLGFHDDMAGITSGPVSYQVYGWYAYAEDDPLMNSSSLEHCEQILQNLGWSLGSQIENFSSEWPKAVICYGSVQAVAWGNYHGESPDSAGREPKVGDIKVSVGATGIGALGALLARQDGQKNKSALLTAFAHGVLGEIDSTDQAASLDAILHAEGFASFPGGYKTERFLKKSVADATVERPDDAELSAQHDLEVALAKKGLNPKDWVLARKQSDGQTEHTAWQAATPSPSDDIQKKSPEMEVMRSYHYTASQAQNAANIDQNRRISAMTLPESQMQNQFNYRRRTLPRFYQPRDPVVLVAGINRSMKHGEDGFFEDDGKLRCRSTDDVMTGLNVSITNLIKKIAQDNDVTYSGNPEPIMLTKANIFNARPIPLWLLSAPFSQLSSEIRDLIVENTLLDITLQACFAELAFEDVTRILDAREIYWEEETLKAMLCRTYLAEISIQTANQLNPDAAPQLVLDAGQSMDQPCPSFTAKIWEQPWNPIHLDWEVEWRHDPKVLPAWELQETDFVRTGPGRRPRAPARIFTDRTMVTPSVARQMSESIGILMEKNSGDGEPVSDGEMAGLTELRERLLRLNVVCAPFGGLTDMIMQRSGKMTGKTDGKFNIREHNDAGWLRSGTLKIKKLRVVDTFGRTVQIDDTMPALKAMPVEAELSGGRESDQELADTNKILLPPRICQPARLMFRLLDAGQNDLRDADPSTSPICGWCMPDHVDEALEFYDAHGDNVGQLRIVPPGNPREISQSGFEVEWEGVPGPSGTWGGALDPTMNMHLLRMIDSLRSWSRHDGQLLAKDDSEKCPISESALSAFLRMVDATGWTVDPMGQQGTEHLSVLIGRPLAVVRAKLLLELKGEPVDEQLVQTPFPVRLGDMATPNDGLMGYFVNDNYRKFYPVHESIAQLAWNHSPRKGPFLRPLTSLLHDEDSANDDPNIISRPIRHPFVCTDDHVMLRPGQTMTLTMIVDPRGGVHATSGILPRKKIDLMREHVNEALARMAVTFRIGPILTDPNNIRMPYPDEIKGNWSWLRKTGPTVWQESDITPADDRAQLSNRTLNVEEGWLALKQGMRTSNPDSS